MKEIIKDLAGTPIGVKYLDLTLTVDDGRLADELVKTHHYSHKATKNRFASFVVNGDKGVIQLGYGIRPALKSSVSDSITRTNFCEFDRMWLSDDLPKFSETKIISMLICLIRNRWPDIHYLITYADGGMGKTGTIYRASNAIQAGKKKVDFYLLANGDRVHPVSMYHRHGTRAQAALEAIYPDIKHVTDGWQYRFCYPLTRQARKTIKEVKH